jgi:hypothetical protein
VIEVTDYKEANELAELFFHLTPICEVDFFVG